MRIKYRYLSCTVDCYLHFFLPETVPQCSIWCKSDPIYTKHYISNSFRVGKSVTPQTQASPPKNKNCPRLCSRRQSSGKLNFCSLSLSANQSEDIVCRERACPDAVMDVDVIRAVAVVCSYDRTSLALVYSGEVSIS